MKRIVWILLFPALCFAWNETGENRAIPVRLVPPGQNGTSTFYCDDSSPLPIKMAQGPAGSTSLITQPANLMTVAPSPSATWLAVQSGTWNVGLSTGSNVIGALSANQSENTAQVSGANASPFLDSAVSSITSTPFVTTAAQAAKQVLPMTTKWVKVSIIGTATDYCQCNVNTENNLAASANGFVMPANPLNFTYLRLRAGGATVMCGAGQGTHGFVSGSVTWGTQP